MKVYLIILVLTVQVLSSCSKFEEEPPDTHWTELRPQTLNTKLTVVNLLVNQHEFDQMYSNVEGQTEIDARLFLYRNQQVAVSDLEVDLELKGSHSLSFPLKSIGITLEDAFDNTSRTLLKPDKILPFHNLDEIKALRLRNSGNDFYRSNMKDHVYNMLAIEAGLNLDLTYGEASVVFVNGQFLGVMELRSEGNSKGISRLYNTTTSHVNLAKITFPSTITYRSGNHAILDSYIQAIEQENLPYLLEHTDLNHFIDYVVFNSFIANYDWPYNNVRLYSIDNGDFRFVTYDLDWCNTMHLDEEPEFFINSIRENIIADLFWLLMTDASFKQKYQERYTEIISLDMLKPEQFDNLVTQSMLNIETEMEYQIQKYHAPETLIQWYQEVELLKNNYKKRYAYFHD